MSLPFACPNEGCRHISKGLTAARNHNTMCNLLREADITCIKTIDALQGTSRNKTPVRALPSASDVTDAQGNIVYQLSKVQETKQVKKSAQKANEK